MSAQFTVIQQDDQDIPMETVVQALTRSGAMLRLDAQQWHKRNPRIFLESIAIDRAEAVVDAFARSGVPCRIVPADRLVKMGNPVFVKNADCEDRLYVHRGYSDQRLGIAWGDLLLASAAPVEEEQVIKQLKPGGASRPRGVSFGVFGLVLEASANVASAEDSALPELTRKTVVTTHTLLDLFAVGEATCHFRIDAESFNYDYLGARKQITALENFRLLLGDLQERAPHMHLPPRTLSILRGEGATKPFRNTNLFDAFNRWQLQRIVEAAREND